MLVSDDGVRYYQVFVTILSTVTKSEVGLVKEILSQVGTLKKGLETMKEVRFATNPNKTHI